MTHKSDIPKGLRLRALAKAGRRGPRSDRVVNFSAFILAHFSTFVDRPEARRARNIAGAQREPACDRTSTGAGAELTIVISAWGRFSEHARRAVLAVVLAPRDDRDDVGA